MKTFKLITAGLLATAVASMASAQTFVKITGSTAFRKATYDAIVDSLNTPKGASIGGTTADFTGDAQAVITGTLKSGPSAGASVVIQTAFGGSVGGVHVLTAGLTTIPGTSFTSTQTWMSASNTLGALTKNSDGTISGATVLTSGTATFDAAATAQAANSDSFQATTIFKTPVLTEENPAGNGTGVVQFYAVKGQNHPSIPSTSYAALSNITPQQWSLLISAGILPLSEFTGNSADAIYDVVAEGRNNDSGTREVTEAEVTLGTSLNQVEVLSEAVISGGTITGLALAPGGGDQGFSSGGTLAKDLEAPISASAVDTNGNPFVQIAYLGKSDKNSAVAGGAVLLNYAGQSGTDADIETGDYTYWGYEHTYYLPGLPAVQQNAINLISNTLRTTSDVTFSGIALTSMLVSRTVDGGSVF
jgi:hypothetical protein